MFSATTNKLGGLLDHETDIITLASRFKQPAVYYVAKQLNVYEILNDNISSLFYKYLSSINLVKKDVKKFSKKWTQLPKGTICKAVRVTDIECFNDTISSMNMCKNIFCCRKRKNKNEVAIEFKIVEDFDEITQLETTPLQSKRSHLSEKTYYLPVDVDEPNKFIDLIPIASVNKNLMLKNSLQTIKNFENINLQENLFEVKLFAESLFVPLGAPAKPKKSCEPNQLNDSLADLNLNQDLGGINKFATILEIYESKMCCNILAGYNLTKKELFFVNVAKQPNVGHNFVKMNTAELRQSVLVDMFEKRRDTFVQLAEQKIKNFTLDINKLETFKSKLNRETNALNSTSNVNNCHKSNFQKIPTVSHFADLVDVYFKVKSSVRLASKPRFHIEKSDGNDISMEPCKPANTNSLNELNSVNKAIQLRRAKNRKYKSDASFKKSNPEHFLETTNLINYKEKSPMKPVKHATNLCRTRSRSLPSILLVVDNNNSSLKKNIL